jgi:hypothetical protein
MATKSFNFNTFHSIPYFYFCIIEQLAKDPSGRTAKDKTEFVWPLRVLISIPFIVSHIFIFVS